MLTGLPEWLLPVLGAVAAVVANRLGIKLPGQPDKITPAPAPAPEADKPLVDVLGYLMKVKAGQLKLDELDKQALATIKPLVDSLVEGGK